MLSEETANCSLLSGSQPSTDDGSEAALRLEDGNCKGGRVDRTMIEGSSALQGVSWLFSTGSAGGPVEIHPWVKR